MGAGTDYRSALETMKTTLLTFISKMAQLMNKAFGVPCMLGEGDIDFGWIMQQLDEIGYEGHIALEYELPEPAPEEGLRIWYEIYQAL